MTCSPLRLGVIGTGKIARIILPQLAGHPIDVAGLTDVSPDAARSLAEELGGVPVFDQAADLVRSPGIDAVYIATPPDSHRDFIQQAVAAGKHVICEKPWVAGAREAAQVLSDIEKLDAAQNLRIGCCASRFCFAPAADLAATMIRRGELGRLRHVHFQAEIGVPPSLKKMPPWKRNLDGGLALDWGVYEIEWLRSTLGDAFDPVRVFTVFDDWGREGTGLDSSYQAILTCASGLIVHLARTAQIGPGEHMVRIRGEAGGLDIPFASDCTLDQAQKHTLDAQGQLTSQTLAGTAPNWSGILLGPLLDLAQAVDQGRPPRADPRSQVLVHQILDAMYASGRTGQTVTLTPDQTPQPSIV